MPHEHGRQVKIKSVHKESSIVLTSSQIQKTGDLSAHRSSYLLCGTLMHCLIYVILAWMSVSYLNRLSSLSSWVFENVFSYNNVLVLWYLTYSPWATSGLWWGVGWPADHLLFTLWDTCYHYLFINLFLASCNFANMAPEQNWVFLF